jgi:glycine/D-amino acid oxidase-like deaminating enzyme
VKTEKLSRLDLQRRFPQIALEELAWGLYEPESGVLMARRAVQAVVREALKSGADYLQCAIHAPAGGGQLRSVITPNGEAIRAGVYVFACGPWLPKVFPDLLGSRIFPTRQEVFFFGVPAGDLRFQPPALPAWLAMGEEVYGLPDLENRGVKIACDRHGPPIDPDIADRVASPESLTAMRAYLSRRFPALRNAPLLEPRVCQYENTSNGDFVIDRHPDFSNVWLVGGGSGHGFKHGPALGEYVTTRILEGGPVDARFSLATKATLQNRAVY